MATSDITKSDEREAFIAKLMEEGFQRHPLQTSRLGRDSNNFVYHIELAPAEGSPEASNPGSKRPGTVALPTEKTDVVIRISNPQAQVTEKVRVQNEVAAMALMRDALGQQWASLVPDVYAWSPASEGFGWILQEYKTGVQLVKSLGELDKDHQRDIVRQIVSIFKLVQQYELPSSVRGYGGLGFNDSGDIVIGETTIPCGGPFDTLQDMYAQMFRRQLDEANTSDRLQGWRQDGLRERLDHFGPDGISRQTQKSSIARPTLVHGDFHTWNMLFDPASNRITALLDFDFAHVASPASEYFYSFMDLGALLVGPFEEGDIAVLRTCLLEGFAGNVPSTPSEEGIDWSLAVMMDEECVNQGVLRPVDIHGSGELAALHAFLEDVSPPYFLMSRWLAKKTPEQIQKIHQSIMEKLDKYLQRWKD